MVAPVESLIELYDNAFLEYIQENLVDEIEDCILYWATPRRRYAEYLTGKVIDETQVGHDTGRLQYPRVTLYRAPAYEFDPSRYNWARVRKLGYTRNRASRKNAYFPIPVFLNYTLNLAAERQATLTAMQIVVTRLWRNRIIYLTPEINDDWTTKYIPFFMEDAQTEFSNMEPEEGDRDLRVEFTIRAEAWIFDETPSTGNVVGRIETDYYFDEDYATRIEQQLTPKVEAEDTGDGNQTSFGFTLDRNPVQAGTVMFVTTCGGSPCVAHDVGDGTLRGLGVTGTITYTTGVTTLTYTTAPDNGVDIESSYFTDA